MEVLGASGARATLDRQRHASASSHRLSFLSFFFKLGGENGLRGSEFSKKCTCRSGDVGVGAGRRRPTILSLGENVAEGAGQERVKGNLPVCGGHSLWIQLELRLVIARL